MIAYLFDRERPESRVTISLNRATLAARHNRAVRPEGTGEGSRGPARRCAPRPRLRR